MRRTRQFLSIGSPGSILKWLCLIFGVFSPQSVLSPFVQDLSLKKIADQLLESNSDQLLKRHRSSIFSY